MRVVLAGAGASAGTVGAPVAKEFGQHLPANWQFDLPALVQPVNDWANESGADPNQGWPLDAVWTRIDNCAKLFPGLGLAAYPPETSLDLRRAILNVYGNVLVAALPAGAEGTLATELARLRPDRGDVVISMNYDVVVEEMAHRGDIHLAVADPHNSRPAAPAITLAKPHGSGSWRQRAPEHGQHVQLGDHPMQPDEVGQHGGQTVQPLVVAPVPFKSEIIAEVMGHGDTNDAYHVLVHQWRVAHQALQEADELAVLGYGFPAEDLYARFLMREAARTRPLAKHQLRVDLYELPERRADVSSAILTIFGDVGRIVTVEFHGPVHP